MSSYIKKLTCFKDIGLASFKIDKSLDITLRYYHKCQIKWLKKKVII